MALLHDVELRYLAAGFGAVLALAIVRMLRRWQTDPQNPFDLKDLFLENGHASRGAVVLMGAYAITSWFFIYYTLAGKMTEGYFTAYAAAWIAPVVARLIFQAAPPATPAAPGGT